MFGRFLRALFNRGDPEEQRPATRLTAQEALRLGCLEARKHGVDELSIATPLVKGGRVVWSLSEAAMGCVLVVLIADDTGEVMSVTKQGIR